MDYAGKGKSNWDVFSQEPGHIVNNDNGNIACDSYHNYRTDVELLKNLKVWVLIHILLEMQQVTVEKMSCCCKSFLEQTRFTNCCLHNFPGHC